jgi:hypothetical protein
MKTLIKNYSQMSSAGGKCAGVCRSVQECAVIAGVRLVVY